MIIIISQGFGEQDGTLNRSVIMTYEVVFGDSCSNNCNTVEPLTNDHPSHTTTFRVTDSGLCSYTNPSRATIPLIRPHQCDSEGGRIRGVLL